MLKHTIAVITAGSLLSACATIARDGSLGGTQIGALPGLALAAGAFVGDDDCLGGGTCPMIIQNPAVGLAMIIGGLLLAGIGAGIEDSLAEADADAAEPDEPLARDPHERMILLQAATGQCGAAVRNYQALRAKNLAAAGRLKLDDKLSTCLALEDARARGTIRRLPHD